MYLRAFIKHNTYNSFFLFNNYFLNIKKKMNSTHISIYKKLNNLISIKLLILNIYYLPFTF